MPIGVADVKRICLSMIGGQILAPVPTCTIAGATTTVQAGGLASLTAIAGQISSVVGAVSSVVGQVSTVAGQLSAIAENPLGAVTSQVTSELQSYCKDNFSGLDTTLSGVKTIADSTPEVSNAYNNLKKAMGGGDGLSGAFSKVEKFKNHCDRISGQVMSVDSGLNSIPTSFSPGGR